MLEEDRLAAGDALGHRVLVGHPVQMECVAAATRTQKFHGQILSPPPRATRQFALVSPWAWLNAVSYSRLAGLTGERCTARPILCQATLSLSSASSASFALPAK